MATGVCLIASAALVPSTGATPGKNVAKTQSMGSHEIITEGVNPEGPTHEKVAHATGSPGTDEPADYPFYPQAGTLWTDTFVSNFVDLDESAGILDWNCTDYTYDGHRGHDSDIASFKIQAIGVPVFAALDGTVDATHDGDPDMNTEGSEELGNFVIIDHGGSHYSWYFHLKKDSVEVEPGEVVRAGTQIGLVGSSGNSTWPHLQG